MSLEQNPDYIPYRDKLIFLSEAERKEIGAVLAVVVNSEHQILTFKRNYKSSRLAGNILSYEILPTPDLGLPAGHVESTDATLEAAVLRELLQETGLKGKNPFPVYKALGKPGGRSVCLAFIIPEYTGELQQYSNLLPEIPGLPRMYEGSAEWNDPKELIKESYTYRAYNQALLEYLELL